MTHQDGGISLATVCFFLAAATLAALASNVPAAGAEGQLGPALAKRARLPMLGKRDQEGKSDTSDMIETDTDGQLPALDKRARLPLLGKRARLPMLGKRARLPMLGKRARLPMLGKRARLPMLGKRARLPMLGKRARLPMLGKRARLPMLGKRARLPMLGKRARLPMLGKRARLPMLGKRYGKDQGRMMPMLGKRGSTGKLPIKKGQLPMLGKRGLDFRKLDSDQYMQGIYDALDKNSDREVTEAELATFNSLVPLLTPSWGTSHQGEMAEDQVSHLGDMDDAQTSNLGDMAAGLRQQGWWTAPPDVYGLLLHRISNEDNDSYMA